MAKVKVDPRTSAYSAYNVIAGPIAPLFASGYRTNSFIYLSPLFFYLFPRTFTHNLVSGSRTQYSYTVCLMKLRNARNSVAPRIYIALRSVAPRSPRVAGLELVDRMTCTLNEIAHWGRARACAQLLRVDGHFRVFLRT